MTAAVTLAIIDEPRMKFPARSNGASSASVAAIVRPSAPATPAVKPSSASLCSGRHSRASASGNSMRSWPITGTATADTSTAGVVSGATSAGTSELETTDPSSSPQPAPSAAPATNMIAVGNAKRTSSGSISNT